MKTALTLLLGILLAAPAAAGHIGDSGDGLLGRGRGGGHGFSIHSHRGWNLYDGELQSYFEDAFAEIVAGYDSGLAEDEDYYASDSYADVVDDLELLADRYDFFLTSTEHSLDRLDAQITFTTEELEYYTLLLEEYATTDDSDESDDTDNEWFARLTSRIESKTERLAERLESLSEWQSTITLDLEEYTAFGASLDAYLATIVEAGGGSVTDAATTDVTSDVTIDLTATTPAAQVAVAPEPLGRELVLLAACLLAAGFRQRRAV